MLSARELKKTARRFYDEYVEVQDVEIELRMFYKSEQGKRGFFKSIHNENPDKGDALYDAVVYDLLSRIPHDVQLQVETGYRNMGNRINSELTDTEMRCVWCYAAWRIAVGELESPNLWHTEFFDTIKKYNE